ncbi:MAG: UvrB/UvrC motif-containing protein [Waddliaceae bacterium]
MEIQPKDEGGEHPDRPLECSECKKPIEVHYTEIVGKTETRTGMCADCPQLRRRLHGVAYGNEMGFIEGKKTGLVCGECGTTLDRIRVGHIVGCSHCYEVFSDVLIEEMLVLKKISPTFTSKPKSGLLYVGRTPGEKHGISPSLRLIALNEALEDTLKREDYEQAAWLRDQIKELTGESEDTSDKE